MNFIAPGIIMMAVIMNSYSNVVSSFFGSKFQRSIEEILVSPTPTWVIISAFCVAGMLRGLIVGIDEFWVGRCMAASGIVTGCGTLALAVLARMNRRVDFEMEGGALTEIVVVCPRCRKKQSLTIGDATCSGCQLRISTRVEEPRCPTCDYLLIGLTSTRCPECGTEIAETAAT